MSLTIELLLLLFWGCLKNVFPPDFIILRSRSPLPKFYLCLSWMRTAMFIQEGKVVNFLSNNNFTAILFIFSEGFNRRCEYSTWIIVS